ncbi:hypothetical protein ACRAWD_28010 [Caulobacter segnis]
MLRGGLGDDVLDGVDGFDIADFNDASSGVTVRSRDLGCAKHRCGAPTSLRSIEGLRGSGFAGILAGDDRANTLIGSYGNDTLHGGAGGDDVLDGKATTIWTAAPGSTPSTTANGLAEWRRSNTSGWARPSPGQWARLADRRSRRLLARWRRPIR